jgi:hypothetical protein
MTRAGGVSTNTQRNHTETRGAKNRRGEFDHRDADKGVGDAGARTNAAAGWSGGRSPPRRNGAAGERRRDANSETSREVADRPVRRERGGRQIDRPGRRWWSRTLAPSAPNPSAVNATRIEGIRNGDLKRARTLRRAPRRTTDADGRTGREGRKRPRRQLGRGRGQTDTPATQVRPAVVHPRRTAGAPRAHRPATVERSPTSAETL